MSVAVAVKSSTANMEQEEEPGGSGCEEIEERLGRRFEARLVALEVEMADTRRSNDEYVTELKECIALRD